jgi:hypothetical protein
VSNYLILPWESNVLDITSYVSILEATKDTKTLIVLMSKIGTLLGAIYFGVRGFENLKKAEMLKP